ncbi:hypothetical protein C7R93_01050 [Brevibacillus fortis]|uniref:Uncharacterized protein n=1 Tax=Brevibacillus fortis TaxID=2126352 RepID=A0A2P7VPA5_9BACL|nr:hypothetical protein C7R93_01050 [Brevibacillus fortis]
MHCPFAPKGLAIKGAGVGVATKPRKTFIIITTTFPKQREPKKLLHKQLKISSLLPSKPYASMPTPKEIRDSKDKNDRKESISDRIGREVQDAKEKIKDIFKW